MPPKAPWVPVSGFYTVCSDHLCVKLAVQSRAPENSRSPVPIVTCPVSSPHWGILPVLRKRTKKSRSVPNTNKDHIFSTRLHPVNCEPEGRVEWGRLVGTGASHSWQPIASLSRQEHIADRHPHAHHKVGPRNLLCCDEFLLCFLLPISIIILHGYPESRRSVTTL